MKTKSQVKLVQKTIIFGVILLGLFITSASAQAFTYTGVLQLGSTGSQVTSLQQKLGVTPVTGTYDYVTRGAVVDFQISQNLAPDGVVGPATGQALSLATPAPTPTPTKKPTTSVLSSILKSDTTQYPDGCTATTAFSATTGKSCEDIKPARFPDGCKSTTGYSITTGLKCSLPVGCTVDSTYSSITGQICDGSVPNIPLIAGCTGREGYSATTGASCLTGKKTTPIKGTEGILNIFTKIASYENKKVPENKSNIAFAGYTLSGEKNSDIRIDNVKLEIQFTSGTISSKLSKYAKAINIKLGGVKVGSLAVDSLSKSGSVYSGNFDLSGAVVRGNSNSTLYVTADTTDTIDSADTSNSWAVTITQLRYTDGLNRVYYDSSTGDLGANSRTIFHFLPAKDTTR